MINPVQERTLKMINPGIYSENEGRVNLLSWTAVSGGSLLDEPEKTERVARVTESLVRLQSLTIEKKEERETV